MKRAAKVIFLLVFGLLPGLHAQEREPLVFSRPWIGLITKDGTHMIVNFDFGIEQWEDSKRSTHRYQTWFLDCEYPASFGKPRQTYCSLERTVMDSIFSELKTMVSTKKHNTEDGTLVIKEADWRKGKLSLAVVYRDGSTTEVLILMKYEENQIFLDSFKALSVARGILTDAMTSVEYRIPEYDYTLQIPILMRGYKSATIRRREKLKSLSKKDFEIWKKLERDPELLSGISPETVKKALPDHESGRSFTPDEVEKLKRIVLQGVREKLRRAGISGEGQDKILEYLPTVFFP